MRRMPGGCAPGRNVWDAGAALGAVLREGPCGFLWGVREDLGLCCIEGHVECLALRCRGCPGGSALWRGVWVALACGGCCRGCAVWTDLWNVLGCVVVHGMPIRAVLQHRGV